TQPKGFEDPYFPKHVYKVVKALYGLHQVPKAWCEEFEVLMKGEFEMSAMGEMSFFLGLQVKQLPDGIFISQDKYVKDMLTKFDMESVRTATTPYEAAKTKLKDDSDPPLEAYSDSDYAGSHGDRKSTTGGCQFLGRRLISWQCKKQTIVATSSTEAEYVAAASCCAQVLWIQNQLLDYGFNFMNTKIFIDNQSTICIVKNPVFHQRTKHIEIRHHFIRDANEKNLIQVLKIHTNDNVADLLTKAFDGPRFEYLVVHIGMVVNTAARCTFFLLTGLVSAGRTMVLLVVILSAGRLVSAGRTMVLLVVILSAGRLVSAGRTMILLVVILSAGRLLSFLLDALCLMVAMAYAADSVYMLVGILLLVDSFLLIGCIPAVCMVSAVGGLFLLAEYIHAAGVVYAAITSIHAAGLVCAGSIMVLLADLFLLVVSWSYWLTYFCW
ncbi:putative ribonuclease H-like domain-containing protein, partial [Tanacetum coccineum]